MCYNCFMQKVPHFETPPSSELHVILDSLCFTVNTKHLLPLIHFRITLWFWYPLHLGDAVRKRRRWVRPFCHLTVKESTFKRRLGHSMNPNFAQGLKSWCGDAMLATIDKVLHNLTSLLLLKAYFKSECNYAPSFFFDL
jgi:hypothetical protein